MTVSKVCKTKHHSKTQEYDVLEGDRKSGAKTGTKRSGSPRHQRERGGEEKLQESPVRPEQAKASPVGLEQAKGASPVRLEQAKDASPVRLEQAKASPVGIEQARKPAQALSDLNRQASPVGLEQAMEVLSDLNRQTMEAAAMEGLRQQVFAMNYAVEDAKDAVARDKSLRNLSRRRDELEEAYDSYQLAFQRYRRVADKGSCSTTQAARRLLLVA